MLRIRISTWAVAGLLAFATAVPAAPAPFAWPFGLLGGEVGWRYEQGYSTWPGSYWRGPERPPCAADPEAPATWGVLRLGGRFDPSPPPVTDVAEAVVPLTPAQPVINGVVGYDEWQEALPVVTRLDEGGEIFVLLQRSDSMLYLCLGVPSAPAARAGQVAEVAFDRGPTACTQLAPQHLLLRATLDNPEHTTVSTFTGSQGRWVAEPPAAADGASVRARGSSAGDAAWAYPVFEFAIPLSRLDTPEGRRVALGFMLRVQTFSRGRALPMPGVPPREAIYWPDGRTTYGLGGTVPVSERPDFWGHVRLDSDDPEAGLCAAVTPTPVRVDGQLGLKEWQNAVPDRYVFPGEQWRTVQALRDEQFLYLGVRVRAARGRRQGECCAVYLDCAGDGGLRPRSDDRQFRLPLTLEACPELLSYRDRARIGGVTTEIKGAAYPLSAYESCYEFALPLTLFGGGGGSGATASAKAPAVAVEVSYNAPGGS